MFSRLYYLFLNFILCTIALFDRSVDSIMSDFTKLDAKLERAQVRYTAKSVKQREKARAASISLEEYIASQKEQIASIQDAQDALHAEAMRASKVRAKVQAFLA